MEPLDVEEKTHKETAKKGICIENIEPEKRYYFPLFFFLTADSLKSNQIHYLIFFVTNNGFSGITVSLQSFPCV